MNPSANAPRFLRRKEAAKYVAEVWKYPLSPNTLAKLCCTGGGPPYVKLGRYPMYSPDGIDEWMRGKLGSQQTSSSETTKSGRAEC
jgi:hypothetical protein